MVYKVFDKKSIVSGIVNNEIKQILQLAEELQKKAILRNFEKRTIYTNIYGVDLADLQSLSKYYKRIRYLLFVIDLFNKYAWVIPIKIKSVLVLLTHFKKYSKNLIENQKKNELIRVVNFTTILLKND